MALSLSSIGKFLIFSKIPSISKCFLSSSAIAGGIAFGSDELLLVLLVLVLLVCVVLFCDVLDCDVLLLSVILYLVFTILLLEKDKKYKTKYCIMNIFWM